MEPYFTRYRAIRAASLVLSLYVFRDYWARQFLLLAVKPADPRRADDWIDQRSRVNRGGTNELGNRLGCRRPRLYSCREALLVTGAANPRSIAWAVANAVKRHGGAVALTYQAARLKRRVGQLADELGGAPMIELDVGSDAAVRRAVDELPERMPVLDGIVHSIAWAPAEDLQGSFVQTSRDGFAQANDISSYSLIATAREARRLMTRGGAIVTMTYAGSWRVVPNYNVMGPAKASLESAVRYLAADLGPEGIRVNAVSAGPIATVAARTIKDFSGMLELLESHTPLRRNVTSDEVADATVFLLSDLSRAITGEVVHVDAGAHATI